MTCTDIAKSFPVYVKTIDDAMIAKDSFVTERIMQQYRSAHDKEAFVAALIGKLLVTDVIRRKSAIPDASKLGIDSREVPPIAEELLRSAGYDLTPRRYPRGTPRLTRIRAELQRMLRALWNSVSER